MEYQRQTIATLSAGSLAAGVLVWQASVAIMAFAAVSDVVVGGFANASSLGAVAVAVITFFGLMRAERVRSFVDAVWVQLYAAHWPGREETANNTLVVVGATVFFSALLSVYDLIWRRVTDLFLYSV